MGKTMRHSRVLQVALICIVAITMLAGCAPKTFGPSASFGATDPQALLIAGYTGNLSVGMVIVGKYDPSTGKMTGWVRKLGDDFGQRDESFILSSFLNKDRIKAFRLNPGEYAIFKVQAGVDGMLGTRVVNTDFIDRERWAVTESTPVFSLRAGEATYIGDIVANLRAVPAVLTVEPNEPALQEFLVARPGLDPALVQRRLLIVPEQLQRSTRPFGDGPLIIFQPAPR